MIPSTNSLKNIIFDYGGVILNIDYHLTVKAFASLGIADFGTLYSQAVQNLLFDHLETGNMQPDAFCDAIRTLSNLPLTNPEIVTAWNAIILDMPAERIRLLENLKSRYRIFLLSNTNAIHYPVYLKELQDIYGYTDFNGLFEKAYFSFHMGMKKPDAEIFLHVLRENSLMPSETLFIDDSIQHIHGAGACGLPAFFLKPGMDIRSLFAPDTLDFIPPR